VKLCTEVRLVIFRAERFFRVNRTFHEPLKNEEISMKKLIFSALAVSLLIPATAFAGSSREDLQVRIDAAKVVMDEIMNTPDNSIPLSILKQATCVAVIPSLKKAAFLVGAEYGQGVVTCRSGHGWSGPVFIRLVGGSFGFQAGGQATDLILVAVNDRGFQDLLKSKFKIGGDAAASAGPVGRNSQASTDWKMNAELLTYSRSKGLFAGIDLNGATVSQNSDDTAVFYGQALGFPTILRGDVAVPPGGEAFVRTVARSFVDAKSR
jgi:SH3 domain-containing YSC84-like protein 1